MKREQLARLITFGVLGGAIALVALRNRPASTLVEPVPTAAATNVASVETPVQDAVYAMFDAAKQGNVDAYLEAYSGAVRASLDQSLAEQGREKFAAYLREQTASVKGIALQEPQKLTDAQARIQVEYVYQDRNETQWLTLDKAGSAWKIVRIEAAQRVKTLVPYGTPVN
jgi:hypothetical protein